MAKAGLHLTVSCVQCGVAFRQSRSDQLCCSYLCSQRRWRSAQPKLQATARACEFCKSPFSSAMPTKRFCSDKCREDSRLEKLRADRAKTEPGRRWAAGKKFAERSRCISCDAEFYAPPVLKRRGGGKYCSNDCRVRAMANCPENYPQSQSRRGKGGRREDLGGQYFRSAWEANYARYLNWLVSKKQISHWEFEVDTFEFHAIKRGQRFYTPDFKVFSLSGKYEYHEIKGYMDDRSATKLKRMAKYYPGEKIIVLGEKEYKSIAKVMGPMLPHWEGQFARKSGAAIAAVIEALKGEAA